MRPQREVLTSLVGRGDLSSSFEERAATWAIGSADCPNVASREDASRGMKAVAKNGGEACVHLRAPAQNRRR